jgi:chromosome partitioning protein
LIDCPPSLGLLTVNALAAADDLVVPVQCEYFALEGLGQLVGNAERVRRSVNPDLRVLGFLLTMYDARTKLAGQVGAEVRAHFGELVFRTVIPRSVRLSEAPSFGEPVLTLDPSSRGSISYRLLAAEVSARLGLADRSPADAEETPPSTPAATDMAAAGDARPSPPAVPGPGGRGYGVVSAEPEHLDHAWPIGQPWVGAP